MGADLHDLTDHELAGLLEQLEDQERGTSRRRRKLHELITFRKTMGYADGTPASPEDMAELDAKERDISAARKELHARIADVRCDEDRRQSL